MNSGNEAAPPHPWLLRYLEALIEVREPPKEDLVTAQETPEPTASDTIVLIHGFWVTPRSWEKWVERFEAQ